MKRVYLAQILGGTFLGAAIGIILDHSIQGTDLKKYGATTGAFLGITLASLEYYKSKRGDREHDRIIHARPVRPEYDGINAQKADEDNIRRLGLEKELAFAKAKYELTGKITERIRVIESIKPYRDNTTGQPLSGDHP